MAFWNFPSTLGGNINSINDAAIETFRNNVIEAKVREDIQNSLDAVKDKTKPVIVEFSHFTIPVSSFPHVKDLYSIFQQCEKTWEGRNKKSEDFIRNGLRLLNNEKISFLRISDFNTTGLIGAKEGAIGTPWSSLVKESGSSNKGDSSGGSFGIGKAASFLASDIRTIFYSSYASDNYKSHIGVSNIMSYKTNDNKITVGKGYYTTSENSTAIEGLLDLDPSFQRSETGTDIYVSAFNPHDDWKNEMVFSIIKNFFITIYENKLVVKLDKFIIDSTNIESLMEKTLGATDEELVIKHYFQLLKNEKRKTFPYPAKKYRGNIAFDEGEATLYLIDGEDLNRRVLMTRETGMYIYEQKNTSGSISFTGLLRITGTHMNKVFKEMENPAHNEWVPNRHEIPSVAKNILTDLRRFIRDTVRETYTQTNTESMDAIGMSEFLPNHTLMSTSGKGEKESLSSRIKTLNYEKKETVPTKKKKPKKKKKDDIQEILGASAIEGEGDGGIETKNTHHEDQTSNENTSEAQENKQPNPGNQDGQFQSEPKEFTKSIPLSSSQKYICLNRELGMYKFQIQFEKAIQHGKIEITGIGEQSDFDIPITDVSIQDSSISVTKIEGNTLYFTSEQKTKVITAFITIDYSQYCTMEVTSYETK